MNRPVLYLKVFGLSLALSLAWQYYQSRIFIEFIQQLMLPCALAYVIATVVILWMRHHREAPLSWGALRRQIASAPRTPSWINTVLFFSLLLIAITIAYPKFQFSRAEFYRMLLFQGALLAVIGLAALLISRRRWHPLFHLPLLLGSLVLGYGIAQSQIDPPLAQSTALQPVMAEPFTAFNGPNGHLVNTHYNIPQRRYISFLLPGAGPFQTNGGENISVRDARARGTPIHAPAEAEVVNIVDHLPDLPLGTEDISHPPGNYVCLRLAPDRYLFLANLQQDSVTVKTGDTVHPGQLIARLGKNGSFTESCLILLLVNDPNVNTDHTRSLPFYFTGLVNGAPLFPRNSTTLVPRLHLGSTTRSAP